MYFHYDQTVMRLSKTSNSIFQQIVFQLKYIVEVTFSGQQFSVYIINTNDNHSG